MSSRAERAQRATRGTCFCRAKNRLWARDARDLHLASEEPPLGARAKNRLLGYDEGRGFLMRKASQG